MSAVVTVGGGVLLLAAVGLGLLYLGIDPLGWVVVFFAALGWTALAGNVVLGPDAHGQQPDPRPKRWCLVIPRAIYSLLMHLAAIGASFGGFLAGCVLATGLIHYGLGLQLFPPAPLAGTLMMFLVFPAALIGFFGVKQVFVRRVATRCRRCGGVAYAVDEDPLRYVCSGCGHAEE